MLKSAGEITLWTPVYPSSTWRMTVLRLSCNEQDMMPCGQEFPTSVGLLKFQFGGYLGPLEFLTRRRCVHRMRRSLEVCLRTHAYVPFV